MFLVMELIEGGELFDFVNLHGPPSEGGETISDEHQQTLTVTNRPELHPAELRRYK